MFFIFVLLFCLDAPTTLPTPTTNPVNVQGTVCPQSCPLQTPFCVWRVFLCMLSTDDRVKLTDIRPDGGFTVTLVFDSSSLSKVSCGVCLCVVRWQQFWFFLHYFVSFLDSRAGKGATPKIDHAVIGGVVAVVMFVILCTLIILGRYFARHKGKVNVEHFYSTSEGMMEVKLQISYCMKINI